MAQAADDLLKKVNGKLTPAQQKVLDSQPTLLQRLKRMLIDGEPKQPPDDGVRG